MGLPEGIGLADPQEHALYTSEVLGISDSISIFHRVVSVSTWTLLGPCRELGSALSFTARLGESQEWGQEDRKGGELGEVYSRRRSLITTP